MANVWKLAGVPAAQRIVLLKLADCAHHDGENAFPSVATMANECGLSERSVQNALRRLESSGLIDVQVPATRYRSTTYRVVMGARRAPLAVPPDRADRGVAFSGERVRIPNLLHAEFQRALVAGGLEVFDLPAWYRVARELGPMVDAQIANAKGIKFLVIREKGTGKFKRVAEGRAAQHDPDEEIIEVWEKDPSVQAFDSLLNRALGKPIEQIELQVSGEVSIIQSRLNASRARMAARRAERDGAGQQ